MLEFIKYLAEIPCRLWQPDASLPVTSTNLFHQNEITATEHIQRKASPIQA